MSSRRLMREDGGRLKLGLVKKKVELGVTCVAMKLNLMFGQSPGAHLW